MVMVFYFLLYIYCKKRKREIQTERERVAGKCFFCSFLLCGEERIEGKENI